MLSFRTFRLKEDFKISAKSQAPCFGGRLVCVTSCTSARATRGDLYQPCFISKSHTNMLKLKSDSLSSKDSFQARHNLIILLILLIKYCFAAQKVHTQPQPGKYQVTRSPPPKKKATKIPQAHFMRGWDRVKVLAHSASCTYIHLLEFVYRLQTGAHGDQGV